MSSNYLPTREADLLAWSTNLSQQLAAGPEGYGLTIEEAAAYAAVQSAFAAAMGLVSDPLTRNTPAIADKNDKKQALIAATRPLVQTLQAWPEMTNAKRETLEIPVRDYDPTPVGPPEQMPVLRVTAVRGRVLDLQLLDQDNKKQKPAGVRSAWLYSHTGMNPPTNLQAWRFEGGSTKSNPQLVIPDDVAVGTEVWVTAQWVSPTDKPGPACAPVKTHINYVGLNEAA